MTYSKYDRLLEDIIVHYPDEREYAVKHEGNTGWVEGWYAVSTGKENIIAYFQYEEDAFAFRMMMINARLNLSSTISRYQTTK